MAQPPSNPTERCSIRSTKVLPSTVPKLWGAAAAWVKYRQTHQTEQHSEYERWLQALDARGDENPEKSFQRFTKERFSYRLEREGKYVKLSELNEVEMKAEALKVLGEALKVLKKSLKLSEQGYYGPVDNELEEENEEIAKGIKKIEDVLEKPKLKDQEQESKSQEQESKSQEEKPKTQEG